MDYGRSESIQFGIYISYIAVMPNRNLSADELKIANDLLSDIRGRLIELAAGDPLLLFAYRRKVAKELVYDERGAVSIKL